ncbi:MAG: hypothetical protein ACREO3_02200 [Arenimonas sp.]
MNTPAAVTETVIVEGLSNAEFLERYAAPGRVGLCGGNDLINKGIRKLQYHLTADGHRSPWSHAFLCSGRRVDGRHWVLESDLDLAHKQIRLGVQENRIDRYHADVDFPNLAILDFGLDDTQTQAVLTSGLDLLSGLSHYSLRELLGTLLAMRHPGLRRRRNLLEREGALYCSAMVQHCYSAAGIEFVAGVDRKNVTPHDIGACGHARTAYLLVREAGPTGLDEIRGSFERFIHAVSG